MQRKWWVFYLIEVANADTVYRDFYLRRARQLLSAALDESAYRAIGSTKRDRRCLRRSRRGIGHTTPKNLVLLCQ